MTPSAKLTSLHFNPSNSPHRIPVTNANTKRASAVIAEEQHTAVGKETRETAHVERWNNTLRQRLARFVRMTLSFSKSGVMHEACLRYCQLGKITEQYARIAS